MQHRTPETEPYEHGMLDVGDGHRLYWEQAGNPQGIPVIILHGGPGSGCSTGMRRLFDPARFRSVLLDQRNSGRSTPHGSDPAADLSTNTTAHLIADIERLREHLGIERWLVWGGSWGVTLGLAYAEAFSQHVTGLLLVAVTNTTQTEIDWLYHGAGQFLPEAWDRFRSFLPESDRDGDLVAAYHRLLHHSDPAEWDAAAVAWCDWENAVVDMGRGNPPHPRYADPVFRVAFARIVTHYFHHGAWLEEGQILRDANRLRGIPGIMIHGRLDLGGPPITAWKMAQAWPDADLVYISDAGHSSSDPGMAEAHDDAIERFAALLS